MSTSTHPFTCVTCGLAFASSSQQRTHYSEDLHKYNAKRKVADLPPVSAAVFNDKIAERRAQIEGATKKRDERLVCSACDKRFGSDNVYNDHLKSKKHRENVLKGVSAIRVGKSEPATTSEQNGTDGSPDSDHGDAELDVSSSSKPSMPSIDEKTCLFCPRSFNSLEINLKHMANNHAFYIPDQAFCANIPGLLSHMANDIALGNICIFCGHGFGGLVTGQETDAELVKRARRGLEAVRKHMVDKGHCRIPWDTEEQRLVYSDFYDYRSSYPDYKPGEEMEVDSDEQEDWEDDEDSEIDENDEVVVDYSAIRRKVRKPMEEDLDLRLQVGEADYELVLPSGTRIGHRALRSVYKQNVMPYVGLPEDNDKVSRLARVLDARAQRKESGALVQTKPGMPMVVARNAGEAREAKKATRQFKEQRRFNDHLLKVGKVHNNQKHFRDPLLQ